MKRFALLVGCALGASLTACSAGSDDEASDYELVNGPKREGSSTGSTAPPSQSDDPTESSSSASSAPGQGGAESSTGTSGSTGTGAGSATPMPTKVTMKIDGSPLTVGATVLWSEASGPGKYDIFVSLSGPGVAVGSDIHVVADRVGSGCVPGKSHITYRPKGDSQYMPLSSTDPSCGLKITQLPTAIGGRFKGSFFAQLRQINTTNPQTKLVDLDFDVLREK